MKYSGWVMLPLMAVLFACSSETEKQSEAIVEKTSSKLPRGKSDSATGLIIGDGFATVKKNCTACHSPKLIAQNKATREGWLETIRWMQATQNLRQFDANTEDIILTYLAKNYPPENSGRRAALRIDKWYRLTRQQ